MTPVQLSFLKMHGLGNDFVIIDGFANPAPQITPELARKIGDRRFGVGFDQLLIVGLPRSAGAERGDARMDILNSDGSTAEMCGNGIRAVALFLTRHSPLRGKTRYTIETLDGLKSVSISMTPDGEQVTVDMGEPWVADKASGDGETLEIEGRRFRFHEITTGNPHAVFFVGSRKELETLALETLGPKIETHPRFPRKTNVEFVFVESPSSIHVRVWERGAGITLACGTGACASATAALVSGRAQGELTVHLPGGKLWISWAGAGHSLLMRGPATEVFRGEMIL